MAVVDVLNTIFTDLDMVGASAVQSLYTGISTALQPVFTVAMTIYIAYYGYEIIFGRATISATEFVWRLFRMGLVYGLAFTWGDFQTVAVNSLSQTADSVAGVICTSMANTVGGGASCLSASATSSGYSAVATGLNTIWTTGSTAAYNIMQAGGYTGVGLMILGILLDVITGFVIVEAVFIMLMGKLGLYLLLGLAPIFIAMALFELSSSLFAGWLRTCLSFAIVPLLTYGFLGFFLGLISAQQTALNGAVNGGTVSMLNIAPFAILCIVSCLLLAQVPAIASGITGGAGLRHTSPLAVAEGMLLAGGIRGAAGAAGSGARNAGRQLARAGSSAGRTTINVFRTYAGGGSAGPNTMSAGANGMSAGSPSAAQVSAGLKANKSS